MNSPYDFDPRAERGGCRIERIIAVLIIGALLVISSVSAYRVYRLGSVLSQGNTTIDTSVRGSQQVLNLAVKPTPLGSSTSSGYTVTLPSGERLMAITARDNSRSYDVLTRRVHTMDTKCNTYTVYAIPSKEAAEAHVGIYKIMTLIEQP